MGRKKGTKRQAEADARCRERLATWSDEMICDFVVNLVLALNDPEVTEIQVVDRDTDVDVTRAAIQTVGAEFRRRGLEGAAMRHARDLGTRLGMADALAGRLAAWQPPTMDA
jgi:hypothetical protein